MITGEKLAFRKTGPSSSVANVAIELCGAYGISPKEVAGIDISIAPGGISSISFRLRPDFDNKRTCGIIDAIAKEARACESERIVSSHNF